MTPEHRQYEDERRARHGRPPRPYDPAVLDEVRRAYSDVRHAEDAFLVKIDEAITEGVPLRDLESVTGISRSRLSRGPTAYWHTF